MRGERSESESLEGRPGGKRRLSRRALILLGLNAVAVSVLARKVQERRVVADQQAACLDALAQHRALYEAARSGPNQQASLRAVESEIRTRCG